MARKSADQVTCSVRRVFQVINIILGLLIIGLGIYSYVKSDQIFKEGWWKNPWVIFVPFYSIVFGVVLILCEFEVFLIQVYFVFLNNYFGRGIFLIYLATVASGNMTGVDDVFVYIVSGLFAFTGVVYLFFGCFLKTNKEELRESLIDKTSDVKKSLKESKVKDVEKV